MNCLKKVARVDAIGNETDSSFFLASNATVVGEVVIGKDVSVWFGAVIRGDEAKIEIGDKTNVQDNVVIHCDPGAPMKIGSQVTIGHGAILHGAVVGDRVIVGMGAILLSGTEIGNDSLVAAGSVVTPNKKFPDRSLIMGSPAKVVKQFSEDQIDQLRESADHYLVQAQRSSCE